MCYSLRRYGIRRIPHITCFENRRFTVDGYARYWEAVNATVKFTDTILVKKITKKKSYKPMEPQQKQGGNNKNKYKWVNSHVQNKYDQEERRDTKRYQRYDDMNYHKSDNFYQKRKRSYHDEAQEPSEKRRRYPTPPPRRDY